MIFARVIVFGLVILAPNYGLAACVEEDFPTTNGGRDVDIPSLVDCINFLKNNALNRSSIIKTTYAAASGPEDGQNDGRIISRTLRFLKDFEETDIKIVYSDNLRATKSSGAAACRWIVKVDGTSCGDSEIYSDRHDAKNANIHSASTIVGYCSNLKKGWHTVDVWVGPTTPDYDGTDCYTGWKQKLWSLEATELFLTPSNSE